MKCVSKRNIVTCVEKEFNEREIKITCCESKTVAGLFYKNELVETNIR